MKKLTLTLSIVVAVVQSSMASVTINFGLGQMYSSTNTVTFFPTNGLVNILALTNGGSWGTSATISNTFANLTSSFIPANSVLVASFGNNNDGGNSGTVGTAFNYSYSGAFVAGAPLLAVGYGSLTTNSTSPGNGVNGFFFRTDSIIDGSDIAWTAPADGQTVNLYAYTASLSGSLGNSQFTSGDGAAGGNGFTTVPEPSTYALLAMSALGLGGYVVRRRNRS